MKTFWGTLRGYRWWNEHSALSRWYGIGAGHSFDWTVNSSATCWMKMNSQSLCAVSTGKETFIMTKEHHKTYWPDITPVDYYHTMVPDPLCQCGFYAFYDPVDAQNYLNSRSGLIFGVIEAYGKIIPAERGFRAERATIKAVVHPRPYQPVDFYAKVERLPSMEALVTLYPPQRIL